MLAIPFLKAVLSPLHSMIVAANILHMLNDNKTKSNGTVLIAEVVPLLFYGVPSTSRRSLMVNEPCSGTSGRLKTKKHSSCTSFHLSLSPISRSE